MQNNPIIYLLERAFGSSVFNSGPDDEIVYKDFGHYNPLFLEKVIGSFKSLSPISKKIIQPFYDSHFKGQLRELIQNRISVYFSNDSNKNFLEKIKNRYDHNLLVQEIKASNPEIPFETLFWIRRDYDGTSNKFLTLFELIIEEFDIVSSSSTFLEKYNNTAWTDGTESIIFRSLSSIEYRESKKPVRGYVFDGFLKKTINNIKLYNDPGYFIIIDSVENTKNIYTITTKSGINVRDYPGSSGNVVGKLMNGIAVNVLSETENMLTINDVDKETGESRKISGKWVEIETYSSLSGHRQEVFPDNNGLWFYTKKIEEPGRFECHMCGYKVIEENTLNRLSFVRDVTGDYGPSEYSKHTFSIEKDEMVEIKNYNDYYDQVSSQRMWIPINSNSVEIDRINNRNKSKEYSQKELDSISSREIEVRALIEEEVEIDEAEYYFLNDANLIENPQSAVDFYNNGLVKFFNPNLQDYMATIQDLNKAIKINGDQDEEWWIKLAYFFRGIVKGKLNLEGTREDWEKAAGLGLYHAKKAIRENGYRDIKIKDKDINKFPGTNSYILSYEGKSSIYDYNLYKIITTPWSDILGPDYADIGGSQIMAISKDGMSSIYIGESNDQFDFRGMIENFLILGEGGQSTPDSDAIKVFDLKNQKYIFEGSFYNEYKIVNSKIEFYNVIDHPYYPNYAESYGKFTKPKCSSELDALSKQYPESIGYIEKLIYDIATQQLERTGIYKCAYFQ